MDDKTRMGTPSQAFKRAFEADDKTRVQADAEATQLPKDELTRMTSEVIRKPSQSAQTTAGRPMPTAEIKTGSVIKQRFQLTKEIGQGGMGVVYSARDLRKEELGDYDSAIAIKFLSQDFKDHPDSLKSLQQESKKAQNLAHPNIATVYDFDREGEQVYMTMELLTGRPLNDIISKLKSESLDTHSVIRIIQDIVQALSYAHEKNIVHSDLKPGNVFITEEGTAKLLDFGIARAASNTHTHKPIQNLSTTAAASAGLAQTAFDPATLGAITPAYASLEMIKGAPPDPRDDIYALACISYELLTGKHPFKRLPADRAQQQGLQPARIPGLKKSQWQGLLQGLAFEKNQRTESAEAFLRRFLPKRKEPWKVAAFVLILITAGSIIYYLLNPPLTPDDIFDNPPPPVAWEALSEPLRTQITDKLELAEMHAEVNRLIAPPGGSALDVYNSILKLHPYDTQAIAGLQALYAKLAKLASSYVDNGYPKKAADIVHSALKFHPNHKALLAIQAKLPADLINKPEQP